MAYAHREGAMYTVAGSRKVCSRSRYASSSCWGNEVGMFRGGGVMICRGDELIDVGDGVGNFLIDELSDEVGE